MNLTGIREELEKIRNEIEKSKEINRFNYSLGLIDGSSFGADFEKGDEEEFEEEEEKDNE